MTEQDKERYFHLSKNEHGTMWLMYKPEGDGRYKCWEPITEEFWNEFEKLESAQQELQAYRDKLKGEVESLRQWTEFFNDDEDGEKQLYHVQGALAALKKVSELIDTVTPTHK